MSHEERRNAYFECYVKININEKYWEEIIDTIKKSKNENYGNID
jgi:hypothetical protein